MPLGDEGTFLLSFFERQEKRPFVFLVLMFKLDEPALLARKCNKAPQP